MAGRAHGVVTRTDLRRAGNMEVEIDGRLRTGFLIAVFRGVYRVGHTAPSLEARYMAAVKARGERVLAELRPIITPPESRGASCSP